MKFPSKRKLAFALAGAALAVGVFVGGAFWSARRALRRATLEIEMEQNLAFTTRRLDRTIPAGVESVSAAAFRDAAFSHDRLYLCGPTGLWEFASDGKLLARYCVGLELPSAPLATPSPPARSRSHTTPSDLIPDCTARTPTCAPSDRPRHPVGPSARARIV